MGGPNAAKAGSELTGSGRHGQGRAREATSPTRTPKRSLGAKIQGLIGSPGCCPGRLTDAAHWRDGSHRPVQLNQSSPATARPTKPRW